jgi:hypothetical protein
LGITLFPSKGAIKHFMKLMQLSNFVTNGFLPENS